MLKNKQGSQQKNKKRLMIGLIVILSVIFIVNLYRFVSDLMYPRDYCYEASSMEYAIRDNDYIRLLNMVKDNEISEEKPSGDTTEYEALAYYYEALVYYRMYEGEDDEKAKMYSERMKEQERKITSPVMSKRIEEITEKVK